MSSFQIVDFSYFDNDFFNSFQTHLCHFFVFLEQTHKYIGFNLQGLTKRKKTGGLFKILPFFV